MMWNGGYGFMGGWGGGAFLGPFHFVIPLLLWGLLIAAVVMLVRHSMAPSGYTSTPRRPAGLDVLEERYARGEINREEYLQKKKDIAG